MKQKSPKLKMLLKRRGIFQHQVTLFDEETGPYSRSFVGTEPTEEEIFGFTPFNLDPSWRSVTLKPKPAEQQIPDRKIVTLGS